MASFFVDTVYIQVLSTNDITYTTDYRKSYWKLYVIKTTDRTDLWKNPWEHVQ